MSKKVIITGVSGQVGSFAADYFLELGYRVYGFKRRTSSDNEDNIKHLKNEKNFEIIQGDLTDSTSILSAVKLIKPDILENYGAMSHVGVSFSEPVHTMYATGISALNCLEAIRTESPHTHMVQSSSSEMYGSAYDERIVDGSVEKYQNELTSMQPVSPYAIAKLAAHHYVKLYRKSYNLFACSSIAHNHESYRRSTSFVTRKITYYVGGLIKACSTGKSQTDDSFIYDESKLFAYPKLRLGCLTTFRDWSHAKDIVHANYLMATHHTPDDFLISSGTSRSVENFLAYVFKLVGLDWHNFVVQDPSLMRPCEVEFLRGDSSKIREVLNWKPRYTFEMLVEEMLKFELTGM